MRICRNRETWARALPVLAALTAGPVAAFEGVALECRFDTECFDAAGCEATNYELSVTPEGDAAVMSDTAEDIPAQIVEIDGTLALVGQANGALRMLTGLEGETARLSVHQAAGDLMLNYTGVCEAAE